MATSSNETSIPSHPAPSYYAPSSSTRTMHAPPSPVKQLSIHDLRGQILANATMLFPTLRVLTVGPNEFIPPHLIVAKTPSYQQQKEQDKQSDQTPDGSQNQSPMSKRPAKPLLGSALNFSGKEDKAKAKAEKAAKAAQAVQEAAAALPPESHYAVLVHKGCKENYTLLPMKVILRGDPRDTVVEALEHILELTETMLHGAIIQDEIKNAEQ